MVCMRRRTTKTMASKAYIDAFGMRNYNSFTAFVRTARAHVHRKHLVHKRWSARARAQRKEIPAQQTTNKTFVFGIGIENRRDASIRRKEVWPSSGISSSTSSRWMRPCSVFASWHFVFRMFGCVHVYITHLIRVLCRSLSRRRTRQHIASALPQRTHARSVSHMESMSLFIYMLHSFPNHPTVSLLGK